MGTTVRISKSAEKQILKLPIYIQEAVRTWVLQIDLEGIERVRKIPGYRDKALSGLRLGQRCVRLNRAYRLFYEVIENDITVILIVEVNKHDY